VRGPQGRCLARGDFTDAAALTPAYGAPPTIELLDAATEGIFEIARRWCGG
jgi:hypothetical protein